MSFDVFASKQFKREMKSLGYKKQHLLEDIWKFRFACYKLHFFIKHVALPPIKSKSLYEAVFVDFRILPHIEFLIRNAILKLGSEWSYTVVCGKKNASFMTTMCAHISSKINILVLQYDNLTQEQYSNLLMTTDFWKLFHGEKLLIYQEDALLFRSGIAPFLRYDFIGAPFHKASNDTPNGVGNGGFSLRSKSKMTEVIETCPAEEVAIPSTTQLYMQMVGMKTIPEDVYFSTCIQERNIGEVADWNTASEFSSEQVFNPNSLGGHKFWISNPDWKTFVKKTFGYYAYIPRSDLNQYLMHKQLPLWFNKNNILSNAFDVDHYFFCRANNLDSSTHIGQIHTMGLDGFVYHPKQLLNIFPAASIYTFQDNLYVYLYKQVFTIQDFVNKYLYNTSFDYLCELLVRKKYDTMNDNYDTYLLVFLGNESIAISLIEKIIAYKKIQHEFNVAFCINTNAIKDKTKLKQLIRENFDFYSIYYSKEFGTDITPTILMYNHIRKTHNVHHIIKLHTKTITDVYDHLTNYLLTMPVVQLTKHKMDSCNCIGFHTLYKPLKEDSFNRVLVQKYADIIHSDHSFVMGTIFYTHRATFESILRFIQKNHRPYLLNNLYENNSINPDFSPIHFLERLFGVIKC